MKQYKIIALTLALVMVLALLSGCGAGTMAMDKTSSANGVEAPAEAVSEGEYYRSEESLTDTAAGSTGLPQDQKIIVTMNMDVETEEMDPLLESISQTVSQLGGYIEAQEVYNGSDYDYRPNRRAELTVRIPEDKLDGFATHVEENANIVSQSTTTENVTLQYVAVESRIKALETEEARLLELLAMAENMEELLLIESRLTEVRTELEQVNSQLRALDNKIDYSTVNLDIREVKEYTEVQPEPETFWERISSGTVKGFKNVGEFLVDLGVFLIVAIPYLLPFAVSGLAVFFIIRTSVRRKRKKNAARKEENK